MGAETFYAELESLLDQEREAILAGEIEVVARLGTQKEAFLTAEAPPQPGDSAILQRLRRKAEKNQHLLGSVLKGIRAVTSRLKVLRDGSGTLNTYNQQGARQTVGPAPGTSIERRA